MKKKIIATIMTIAIASTVTGCGTQNDEGNSVVTADMTEEDEEIDDSEEESSEIEEEVPEVKIEISDIAAGHEISGDLEDYSDYLVTITDRDSFEMARVRDEGIVWGSEFAYSFDDDVFDFNGITQDDTPEDYLCKCVELFGMPYEYTVTPREDLDYDIWEAIWYFNAPNPDATHDYGDGSGAVPVGKYVMFKVKRMDYASYQLYVITGQKDIESEY